VRNDGEEPIRDAWSYMQRRLETQTTTALFACQVSENAAGDASFYRYDDQETFSASQAMMMDYSEVETNGRWSRFW
jgi:hypothetical protein